MTSFIAPMRIVRELNKFCVDRGEKHENAEVNIVHHVCTCDDDKVPIKLKPVMLRKKDFISRNNHS